MLCVLSVVRGFVCIVLLGVAFVVAPRCPALFSVARRCVVLFLVVRLCDRVCLCVCPSAWVFVVVCAGARLLVWLLVLLLVVGASWALLGWCGVVLASALIVASCHGCCSGAWCVHVVGVSVVALIVNMRVALLAVVGAAADVPDLALLVCGCCGWWRRCAVVVAVVVVVHVVIVVSCC